MMLIFPFLLINLLNSVFSNDTDCLKFDILLTQTIENSGFHRDFKWLLEIPHPDSKTLESYKCTFMVELEMPQGAFVNPDQIADLNRINTLKTMIKGDVNVEVMDHEATNHTVRIFNNERKYEKVSITLPFHLRYQRAQLSGEYVKVILPRPNLLVRCSQKEKKICDKTDMKSAPCDFNSQKSCRWFNTSYKALFDAGEVLVPVGNLDHYPLVAIVTLSIGCIGCIYILSLINMCSKTDV